MELLHVHYVMLNVLLVEVDQHVLNVQKDIMYLLDNVQNVVLIIVMYVQHLHQQHVQHVQMDISYYHQLQMVLQHHIVYHVHQNVQHVHQMDKHV